MIHRKRAVTDPQDAEIAEARLPALAAAPQDVLEGRSDEELAALLDATHRVVVRTLHVPERDRYQIVHEHKPSRVRIEDTGLAIPRSTRTGPSAMAGRSFSRAS